MSAESGCARPRRACFPGVGERAWIPGRSNGLPLPLDLALGELCLQNRREVASSFSSGKESDVQQTATPLKIEQL